MALRERHWTHRTEAPKNNTFGFVVVLVVLLVVVMLFSVEMK